MDWSNLLTELLYVVITAAIPVITVYITKYLKARFDETKVAASESILSTTLNKTLDLILSVVTSTSQTYVDTLKSNNKFDLTAQKQAFDMTKKNILSMLTSESKDILATLYKDVDSWIDVQIEAAVRNIKKQ